MVRVSAERNPLRCVPPSTVLMLLAKLKTFSEYPSLYWSATSMVMVPFSAISLSAFEVDRLLVQHLLAAVQVFDEFGDAALGT